MSTQKNGSTRRGKDDVISNDTINLVNSLHTSDNLLIFAPRIDILLMVRIVIYSILYLFGIGENPISFHAKSDYQAIQSDWQKIGMDIQKSMQRYEQQEKRN